VLGVISPEFAPWLQKGLVAAGLAGFGFAFFWFWLPSLREVAARPYAKPVLALGHALLLPLSAAFSGNLIAHALGFPPHDFGFTLSIVTLIIYPLIWLVLVNLLLGLAALVFQLLGFFKLVTRGKFGSEIDSFKHMMGAIGLLSLLAFASERLSPSESFVSASIKRIAFLSDYHVLSGYPGIPSNERVRLHENGVVSIAKTNSSGEVSITSIKFSEK
jgi:hypothetical protein